MIVDQQSTTQISAMSNGAWNTGEERKEFNKLLEICKDGLWDDVVLLDDPVEDELDDLLELTAM